MDREYLDILAPVSGPNTTQKLPQNVVSLYKVGGHGINDMLPITKIYCCQLLRFTAANY